MNIVSMGCGLGNQMFQYAYIFGLRRRYPDRQIIIDRKYMLPQQHNGVELNYVFGFEERYATLRQVHKFVGIQYFKNQIKNESIKYMFSRMTLSKNTIEQSDFTQYYENIMNPLDNKYIYGIFANEKYFVKEKEDIIRLFRFNRCINSSSQKFLERIQNSNSVAIHIRRGDYTSYTDLCLGENYYRKAVDIIEDIVNSPKYFVFSDDIATAKELTRFIKNCEFVTGNNCADSWMDMFLMSQCKHNIIANSSFSFWGAYLNTNPEKIVVCSNRPFSRCKEPFCAEGWIAI